MLGYFSCTSNCGGEPLDFDSPEIYLSEGLHTIVVEHAQVTGLASLTLQWKETGWLLWWTVDTLWQPGGDLKATCEATNGPVPFLNGDFEDELTHWTVTGSPQYPAGWYLTELSHAGQYAVEGGIHTHLGSIGLRSDPFSLNNNSCLTVSLYLREVSDDNGEDWFFKVWLNWYDDQGMPLGVANPITVDSTVMPTNWQMVTGNSQTPVGTNMAELVLNLREEEPINPVAEMGYGYSMRIDDITLSPCP